MITKLKSLKDHRGFMKYFKNTSWLFGEKILRMIVGLFVGIWVARYLGPEQFGLFSYAQSFVGLFIVFVTLGLDGIVTREIIKNDSIDNQLIGTVFWLKFFGSVIVFLFLFVVVNFTSNDTFTNMLIFIIASALIFQSFNIVDIFFQAKVMSKYVVFANFISLLFSTILKIYLIIIEAPLIYFAWSIFFDGFILACGYIYFFLKNTEFNLKNLVFNKNIAIKLLSDSWPFILSGAVLMLQARIDQVMINEMVGTIEVGFYSVAMRLVESVSFITIILKSSLYPSIQNAKKQSIELYQNRLLNFYRLNFLLFLVIAIPLYLFAEQIVVLLFGMDYKPAGILLALMSIRIFFANMGVSRGIFILSENLMKFSMFTMVLGTITNVLLNYLWIPDYGSKGAIVASIVSFFVTIFLVDFFYVKTKKNVYLQIRSILTFYKLNIKV